MLPPRVSLTARTWCCSWLKEMRSWLGPAALAIVSVADPRSAMKDPHVAARLVDLDPLDHVADQAA